MDQERPDQRRFPGMYWAVLVFLAGFAGLLLLAGYFYLLPAYAALNNGEIDQARQKQIVAFSSLLLAVLVVLLLLLMLIVFRVRRFFVNRAGVSPTRYSDAWAESARRLKIKERDDDTSS
ncbi:MAG: hypothetical protein IT448_08875 [Phycisphaerales bacterium]|nr:hypothetical protein [Phycisphaerales bacterium]